MGGGGGALLCNDGEDVALGCAGWGGWWEPGLAVFNLRSGVRMEERGQGGTPYHGMEDMGDCAEG